MAKKPQVYSDTTASGKSLEFIEKYINEVVLPLYANTHTESSLTGLQTSHFRKQARNAIETAFNAPNENYAVIFTGSGVTASIDKFSRMVGIDQRNLNFNSERTKTNPIVFIGPYEHHSNEVYWRESCAKLVKIQPDPQTGSIDHEDLETQLQKYASHNLKIGSFSAASNVTGIRSDTKVLSQILHKYGALACFDFASAGPHCVVNIEKDDIDVAFFSVHKFVGGPQTPGILIMRRTIFEEYAKHRPPTIPGGGTVSFVLPEAGQVYHDNVEEREEGGTPAIVESIRAGLVLTIHKEMGGKIEEVEGKYSSQALKCWGSNPNLLILGNIDTKRVPIISFLVKDPFGGEKFVHYELVTVLLNDLFGIQARGGCVCASPYGHLLMNIDQAKSNKIKEAFHSHGNIMKAGWTRVAFSYYMEQETVDYIIKAVTIVAEESANLLPWYKINSNGSWSYVGITGKTKNDSIIDLWDFKNMGKKYKKPEKIRIKDLDKSMKQAKKNH